MDSDSLIDVDIDNHAPASAVGAVSSPEEQLPLVDSSDRVIGYGSKARLHAGEGLLHRAFSVFLFDDAGRVLLHRRSHQKPLWPGFWTNSCCSHPRRGEELQDAVRRRLREELGVTPMALLAVYHFEYHASYGDVGSEYELCHVFFARIADAASLSVHPDEISECRWLNPAEVDDWQQTRSADLTPWFIQEWKALRGEHRESMRRFAAG